MLKMYLRFVFSFSLLHSNIFTLSRTTLENSLSLKRTQCRTNWHYFSNDESCLLFATSQQGDLTWNDSVKACEINSAETFTLSNSKDLELIEKKIEEKPIYVAQFQKGAWIGKANWSKDDLCDRFDDMQSICMIVVRGLYDQRLCLRSVSCEEFHPFICRTRAMTEEEFDESSMTRVSWWECIIPIWCVVDYGLEAAAQKKQEEQAKAAQVAEIKAYISQFDFNIPSDTELIANSQNKPSAQSDSNQSKIFSLVVGGIIIILVICIFSAACFFVCKRKRHR